MIIYAI